MTKTKKHDEMKITGTLTVEIDGEKLSLTAEQARELRNALIKELGGNQTWPTNHPGLVYPQIGDSGESPLFGQPIIHWTHTGARL